MTSVKSTAPGLWLKTKNTPTFLKNTVYYYLYLSVNRSGSVSAARTGRCMVAGLCRH